MRNRSSARPSRVKRRARLFRLPLIARRSALSSSTTRRNGSSRGGWKCQREMIMKKTGRAFVRKVIFLLTLSAIGATAFAWVQPQTPDAARPNIVLIMSDDMGYADLSSYGASDVKTPNIDSLGRDGVRLTDFYANGVLCSPTRAGFINGRYQQRYLIDNVVGGATPPLKITGESLPQLLKNGGYATGLVGKWHLGTTVQTGPRAHGFENFFGFLGSHIDFYHHNRGAMAGDLWENDASIYPQLDGEYMTDLLTDRSIRFIEQSAAANKPFFVDVAYNAPHWPYQPPGKPSPAPGTGAQQLPQQDNTATRADYAAMVEAVDNGVGKILQTLERLGLTNNTI